MKKRILIFMLGILTASLLLLAGCGISEGKTDPPDHNEENVFFTVRYETDGNGTIEGDAEQSVLYGRNGVTVVAKPNDGYYFLEWSDGLKTINRQETNVRENVAVKAIFAKKKLTVSYETSEGGRIEGADYQKVEMGADGTSVTAIPDEGYEFVKWSDGSTEATRKETNVKVDRFLKAEFNKIFLTITYYVDPIYSGMIEGPKTQRLAWGESAKPVKAVARAYSGVKFLYWSDGCETAERQEKNVTEDLYVEAIFGHEITYRVLGEGGRIEGNTHQMILEGVLENEPVRAVADAGYTFVGWSEESLDPEHFVAQNLLPYNGQFEIYACFEPNEKTFTYSFGEDYTAPNESKITLKREQINDVTFMVPKRTGYSFAGWYADEEYTWIVADEDGMLMSGYQTFRIDSDVLYAKWKKSDEAETVPTHKILLIMIDELHVSLFDEREEKYRDYDYKMVGLERDILSLISPVFSEMLNEWFEGEVKFEVDTFFTTKPYGTKEKRLREREDFSESVTPWGSLHDSVPQIPKLHKKYHNVLTTYSLNDPECKEVGGINIGGLGDDKYAIIVEDHIVGWAFFEDDRIQGALNKPDLYRTYQMLCDRKNLELWAIYTYLHEFTHTVEMACETYNIGTVYEYHKAIGSGSTEKDLLATKKYLRNELEVEGELVGIPMAYWRHDHVVHFIYYAVNLNTGWSDQNAGEIKILSEEDTRPSMDKDLWGDYVPYGDNFVEVEAVPKPGYRFIGWSDGVKTARRTDEDLTSLFVVNAYFKKI